MDTELQVVARPVDGRGVVEALPVVVPQTTVAPAPLPEGQTEHPPKPAQPIAPVDKTSYQDFKAGDTDPLADVVIKEVLIKADAYIVYIDQDLILHWHWNAAMDSNQAVPIFNRAGELLAKSEFLRQTSRKRDLISARRLIGEGLVVMFCTQNQTYANAALDTAEKFITQIGRETSRVWYFGPFFIFFVVSVISGMLLYRHGSMRTLTLPILCSLGGGIGAFISTAIGNERIPWRSKRWTLPSPSGSFASVCDRLLRRAARLAGDFRQYCCRISQSCQQSCKSGRKSIAWRQPVSQHLCFDHSRDHGWSERTATPFADWKVRRRHESGRNPANNQG